MDIEDVVRELKVETVLHLLGAAPHLKISEALALEVTGVSPDGDHTMVPGKRLMAEALYQLVRRLMKEGMPEHSLRCWAEYEARWATGHIALHNEGREESVESTLAVHRERIVGTLRKDRVEKF